MNAQEIVEKLNRISTNPSARFESMVKQILPQFAKDQGKQVLFEAKIRTKDFDFWFPQGINGIDAPIYGEIKYFKEKSIPKILTTIDKQYSPFSSYLIYNGSGKIPLRFILYILPFALSVQEKDQIRDQFKYYINRYEIMIWDIDDLNPLLEKYAEYVTSILPELKDQAVENIITKPEVGDDLEDQLKKLSDAYKQDDLVLFLGAGVSANAGLPTWDSLLSKLLINMIDAKLEDHTIPEDQKEVIANNLKNINNSSPLQTARYINVGIKDFDKSVSDILYKNIGDGLDSELILALKKICTPPRHGNGIKAIVNYNFDDVIEHALDQYGVRNKPIYNDNSFPVSNELGIYHVHGFLPRNPEDFEGILASLLVLSEKSYHTVMGDSYNWSNLTQLNFFRENTCLFVGQSGTDPNLRRLLEIAKLRTTISKHFIILKRTDKEKFLKDLNSNLDDTMIDKVIEIHHHLQKMAFDEIGLNVIWIDDYNEVVSILDKVRK